MYISSDTNVWIDFKTINALALPFELHYDFIMSNYAIQDELLSPPDLKYELLRLGLIQTELDNTELNLVYSYTSKYPQISSYDAFAMAIAKNRNYALLTGDGNLRRAALAEGVTVKGTLWILDELYAKDCLNRAECLQHLHELQKYNGKQVRLPAAEIQKRIDMLK